MRTFCKVFLSRVVIFEFLSTRKKRKKEPENWWGPQKIRTNKVQFEALRAFDVNFLLEAYFFFKYGLVGRSSSYAFIILREQEDGH